MKIEKEPVKRYKDHRYVINAYNTKSNLIAGVEDRETRIDIWKYENNDYRYLTTLDKHCGVIKTICFSNDGELLISGSVTKEIKVWDLKDDNFKVKQTLTTEKNDVTGLKISDDKSTFISIDSDERLIIWKTHKKKYITGKKKKKNYRDVYYKHNEFNKFPYPFNFLTVDKNSLIITINTQSHIFYDISLNEYKNVDKINLAIEEHKKKIHNVKEHDMEEIIIKDKQKPKYNDDPKIQENDKKDSYYITTHTEEDERIITEINQFRENINKRPFHGIKKISDTPIRHKTSGSVEIIVGLDFGTSNTKIAYRRYPTNEVKPIIFNHKGLMQENYFLPSLAVFRNDNKLLLGLDAAKYLKDYPQNNGIYDFKMLFASEVDNSMNDNEQIVSMKKRLNSELNDIILKRFNDKVFRFIVVSYLSYAMKEARNYISKELPNRILDITYNVCIPVDYVNNNIILKEFKKLLATSEFIEREHYEIHNDLEFIDLVYRNIEYDENKSRVFDVPETVAEVASYTKSTSLKEGLHAIIDFGAGTTDISIFNVKNPRQDDQIIAFYSSRIINQGFREIDVLKSKRKTKEIREYLTLL
jgi:hypothetical protein